MGIRFNTSQINVIETRISKHDPRSEVVDWPNEIKILKNVYLSYKVYNTQGYKAFIGRITLKFLVKNTIIRGKRGRKFQIKI